MLLSGAGAGSCSRNRSRLDRLHKKEVEAEWRGGGEAMFEISPDMEQIKCNCSSSRSQKIEKRFWKKFLLKGPFLDPRKIILKNIF